MIKYLFGNVSYSPTELFIFSETLLVIPTVCMQSSVKYVYGREDNFISWSSIDDVIINEVIKMVRKLIKL